MLMRLGANNTYLRRNAVGFRPSISQTSPSSEIYRHLLFGAGSVISGQPQALLGLAGVDLYETITSTTPTPHPNCAPTARPH